MDNYKNTYGEQLTLSDIFRNIGYAHSGTLQTISIDKEKIQDDFVQYHEKCVQFRERFDQYIDEFEQKRYMSPVELLVCTHYRDIDYLFNELFTRIEQFNSEVSQVNMWKYSRCYGHKNIKHLLVKRHLYKNSHEHFFQGNAVMDVAAMIMYHTKLFDWQDTELTEYFSVYLKANQLEQVELYLLGIYLLDPTEYIQAVEDYATQASNRTMIEHVLTIKRNHRYLLQMLSWSSKNLILENDDTD
ncbi:hypothetical protein LG329_03275 [Virgibacillus necropolis]|uniref:hypothetical protein n=1 Tax=Virgibacillus necropolis TaxID=163877 RepID=UPI00385040BC